MHYWKYKNNVMGVYCKTVFRVVCQNQYRRFSHIQNYMSKSVLKIFSSQIPNQTFLIVSELSVLPPIEIAWGCIYKSKVICPPWPHKEFSFLYLQNVGSIKCSIEIEGIYQTGKHLHNSKIISCDWLKSRLLIFKFA